MKGSEVKLVSFMQGSDKRFVIPVYQRNYDWKTENCRQLYDDLIKVIRKGRKNHFFGSIVSVDDQNGGFNEHLVIDGQQRLTTVSLLLLAMHDLIEQGAVSQPKTLYLSEKILNEFLVDKYKDDETRIKLKPVKNDRLAFGRLFDKDKQYIVQSNITINYKYFYDRIRKEEITVDELYDAICRLEIISITLNPDDDPQLIFESLNSTGVALSEGDKIRNYILMGQPPKEQNEYYENYWNKIEILTSHKVDAFIRDYLSVKQQTIASKSRIYISFKEYVEENALETKPLLTDLLRYAGWYEILLKGKTDDNELSQCIYRLNRIETTVTRPFFLEVLRLESEQRLLPGQVREIFLTAENFLLRRTICNLPTNSLNKIFLALHREIMRYDGTDENYVEKFKYALISRRQKARCPDDEEFAAAFSERAVYLMNSKSRLYILERLENYGTKEAMDVYKGCDDGIFSIEHIMPQSLTSAWTHELGDDYKEIYETWINRIANLTLTAYNSKYSNCTFEQKKNMTDGFKDSGFRLNKYIAEKEKWGPEELEQRDEELVKRALEIWSYPETDYEPEQKQLEMYTLSDDAELTGRDIARFSYRGMEQPASSWVDMFEHMLKTLHAQDKSVLSSLAYTQDGTFSRYFSADKTKLRSSLEIDDGIYAEKNTSTTVKMYILRNLFEMYAEDPEDLVMYLRDEGAQEDTQESQMYELRREYWTYALEEIKKAHADTGCFSKVKSLKENWIGGAFGLGGFSINCVANYDSARVELVLSKSDGLKNKAAFDLLYKMKDEIEAQAGVKLSWDRSDKTKSSKIYIRLDGVGIEDRESWEQMRLFHVSWSRKFYDIFAWRLESVRL